MSEEKECPTVRDPVEAVVSRECYDCGHVDNYLNSDFYEYYDAQLGLLTAFECKACSLTNSQLHSC